MTFDPHRPVHVVFAAPWQSVVDTRRRAASDTAWWTFPDDTADGDTVVTVVDAREPAVVGVAVLRMTSEDDWHLVPQEFTSFDPIPVAAIANRIDGGFSIEPRTLHRTEGSAVLDAIEAEQENPTPWFALANACNDGRHPEVVRAGRMWGCNACGLDPNGTDAPRFQRHVETGWPFGEADGLAVCPNCHDVLHQPLGPTFDELMFGNRPACPSCGEHRTFTLLVGMPAGPPPYGTVAVGCCVTGDDPHSHCDACGHEW